MEERPAVVNDSARLVCADVFTEPTLMDYPNTLRTGHRELATLGTVNIGLWEAGPGVDVDIEVDEIFLVLCGRGTVVLDDSTAIELRPGVLVELHAGDRTTWTITERIRKLYVA